MLVRPLELSAGGGPKTGFGNNPKMGLPNPVYWNPPPKRQ